MKPGYKLSKVIFQMREGDKTNNPNECAIGGKWVEKTTDDFASFHHSIEERIVYLHQGNPLHMKVYSDIKLHYFLHKMHFPYLEE